MRRLLYLSLAVNAALFALLWRANRTVRDLKPLPLPTTKPDFGLVEYELRRLVAEPRFASVLSLSDFHSKDWLCRVTPIHAVPNIDEHWHLLEEVVQTTTERCKMPGRVSGWHSDDADPQRCIGTKLEFGYSPEVGYAHPNEFHKHRGAGEP